MLRALKRFLRDTRAGATGITAAAVTVMTVLGMALVVDHVWLVDRRDTLKSAADSASLTATLALRELPQSMRTQDVEAHLASVARRYAWLNLRHLLPDDSVPADIDVTLDIDRARETVSVVVVADIGETLFGFAHGYGGPGDLTQATRVQDESEPLDMVLAIDVSLSMERGLRRQVVLRPNRRIDIVQAASRDLIDILGPNPAVPVRLGVVPWHHGPPCEVGDPCDTNLHEPTVLALTPDDARLRAAINSLRPVGRRTESARGVNRARELLAGAPPRTRKALVLLTDGDDNWHPSGISCFLVGGSQACLRPRRQACRAARRAGIEVFVIAAMAPSEVSGTLGRELTACASQPQNVFLNNATPEALREAFATIARRFRPLRKIS